ncbi:hypothetical protein RYX36_020135, partial [Vicia faba]
MKFECTLFRPYVDELDAYLQSVITSDHPLNHSYMNDASEMSLEEEFLNLSQRKSIEELKDCQDVILVILIFHTYLNMVCVVIGTIKHVIGGNDWWYVACVCNKGVVADSKGFFFPKGFSQKDIPYG